MGHADRDLPSPPHASPLHRTIPGQIVERLAADIIGEAYAPGDRLNENELAQAFGVSRSSLREALRILETRGLVRIEPQRGARVTSLSPEELEHLGEIRAVLIALASRRVAARSDGTMAALLEGLLAGLEASVADPDAYSRASAAAAVGIAKASGNPRLAETIVSFAHQVGRYTRLGLATQPRRDRSLENWRSVFAAIEAGDAEAAERIHRQLALENRDAAMQALVARAAGAPTAPAGRNQRKG